MRTSVTMLSLTLGLALPLSATSAQQRTGTTPAGDTVYLTRRQAILLALRANPQVDIAREIAQQARAQRVQATAINDPVFSASADSVTSIRRIGSAPARPIALSGGIPFPDKLRLRGKIGTAGVDVANASLSQLQQQLAANAGRLYDSVLVVHLQRRTLLDSRELATEFLTRTQARFNGGTVAKLDVIKAQVDLAQSENDLIANRRDVANADAALNRAIGRTMGTALVATDSLAVPPPLPLIDAVELSAFTSRPELRAIEAQQRGARATSSLVRESAFLPDLTLGAGRDLAVPSGITYAIGFAMPIPLLFWQHTRGDFAETRHRELELVATLRDARAAIAQDVRTTYATAEAALRQVVFLRDQLLPSAREAYRISTASYGLGGLSALEVLDARRQLLLAQRQYADALAAANSTRSDLERAAGASLTTFPAGANRE